MANITHIELSDNFNKQRQVLNQVIDQVNGNLPLIGGNGVSAVNGTLTIKTSGDGLSFDSSGNLVGNDAYPNLLTQVVLDPNGTSIVPTTITATNITFPAFSAIFDNIVYYGKKISDFTIVNVPETTITAATGENGAVFVYVDNTGSIQQTLNPISPTNSSTQCLLGSYFRLNNQIQSGSWAYTPWNGATSKDYRFNGLGAVSGGLLRASTTNTLARDGMLVTLEGVNVSTSLYDPNKKLYNVESPYITKEIWPGYDASVSDSTTLDTTHIYNMTDNTVDDISTLEGYIILIPGVVGPTGQDVYLMGMSPKSSGTYTQIYSTMQEAYEALYGIQVSIGNVASRVLWLGQSIIVKIGATDYTDTTQLRIVGELPNVLREYSSAASGGASSRVSGITVKANGSVIGDVDSKTSLNFSSGFTILNTSSDEVSIASNATPATQTEVNNGTDNTTYVTPLTLKNQNYLVSVERLGKALQQSTVDAWPNVTTPDSWAHTIILTTNVSLTMPSVQPAFTDKIITWEVVIKNTNTTSIAITWPSLYQSFNGEGLPDSVSPNSSIFMMMRRYSNNYTLVSVQGKQSNDLI